MPVPTLISTPGASNANSYASVAEGDEYHDSRLFSDTWTDASTDEKTVSLIEATRLLDALWSWESWATSDTQALKWPRVGIDDYLQRSFIPDDSIPLQLKQATAEFARQLIAADRTADSDVETQGIKSLRAGSVGIEFKDDVKAKVVPDAVVSLIPRWWGRLMGRGGGVRETIEA